MATCVNDKCKKILDMDSPNLVMWGMDGDWACNQKCYDEARRQMDHFCSVTLQDDKLFEEWFLEPQRPEVKQMLRGSSLFKRYKERNKS